MTSRPMVLVLLLVILIITSQFEWKQQLVSDLDANPSISQKQHRQQKEDIVKEKVILSQEKNIQRLNELVRNLQQQLLQCKQSNNVSENYLGSSVPAISDSIERQRVLED